MPPHQNATANGGRERRPSGKSSSTKIANAKSDTYDQLKSHAAYWPSPWLAPSGATSA